MDANMVSAVAVTSSVAARSLTVAILRLCLRGMMGFSLR
jgi:hypothetical protein